MKRLVLSALFIFSILLQALAFQPTYGDNCFEDKVEKLLNGETVVIPNIFYDLGKWDLRPESKEALDNLVCLMKNHPEFVIEVANHVDSRASDAYLYSGAMYSFKRAQSIRDYLIDNGIEAERVVANSYGKTKPYTIHEHNEYFEIGTTLTPEFITQFTEDDLRFYEAHQLNRRTEIKLLRVASPPKAEKATLDCFEDKVEQLYKKSVIVPNIFYDLGRWELRPESKNSLDNLVCLMKNHSEYVVEVGSHTDSRGSNMCCFSLSQKRAQSIVDYLIENGIDPDRLVAKGYNESKPYVIPKDTLFFKKGDVLNDFYISKIRDDEEKFETAHQFNRRTEIGLLRTDFVPKVIEPKCDGYFNYADKEFCMGEINVIRNIYYDKLKLMKESEPALLALKNFLVANPNVVVELGYHTDYRASNNYNQTLSEKRARFTVEYLLEIGVDSAQIVGVGYGETKPLTVGKDTLFFKKGDTLNEAYIVKLKDNPEQYEEANQMNRRVEIKILSTSHVPKPEEPKCDGYFKYTDTDFCVGEIHRTAFIFHDLVGWRGPGPEYYKPLDSIYDFLAANPHISIEIGSHTDTRASDLYNLTLSKKRAESLYDYLMEKGIKPNRIIPKGYGETTPYTIPHDFSFFKKGDVLNEEYINKLKDDEEKWEEAHQLNRRTEIKILSIGEK